MSTSTLLRQVQTFIEKYVTFSNPDYSFAAALWAFGTHLFPRPVANMEDGGYTIPDHTFDTFPYLIITSDTKRSGKTRFSEILSFLAARARNFTGASAASIYHSIRSDCPTMINDEAELLAGETQSILTAALNSGYRKGQVVPRVKGDEVQEWPIYCPKVFILIGDVRDTLRDRSIVIRMRRADTKERFTFERARAEGAELHTQIVTATAKLAGRIRETYEKHTGLTFLSDRDEEIWLSLFAVCEVIAPERVEELKRVAVDMATEKTAPARRYVNLLGDGAEAEADDDEYSKRLLRDLASIFKKTEKGVFTRDALIRLYDIPTAPWRKYRGTGLTDINMADMLSRFGLAPALVRIGGRDGVVARGYKRADVEKAARALG